MERKQMAAASRCTPRAHWVTPEVAFLPLVFVNVCFIGRPCTEPMDWLLVDTGPFNLAEPIIRAAEELFGRNNPPKAILLTQGHFDHVGSVVELANRWDVPVFAHPLELPRLDRAAIIHPGPPGEQWLLAQLSLVSRHTIDLGDRQPLPPDGKSPLPDWRWLQ